MGLKKAFIADHVEIFVSAGEASSDIHCAHLIREMKRLSPNTPIKTFGLGGDRLAAEGASLFLHNKEFSVMGGLFEVLSKLPKRRKLERLLEQRLFHKRPDLAILVDNGEINLRLASLLRFFSVPVVYFIPPKIWVWRHSRIEKVSQHVDLVLSILPFEEPIYREWNIPFQYVGNPLIDEVSQTLTAAEARKRIGISGNEPLLTVMPGSRHTEIASHVELFSQAIKKFSEALPSGEQKPRVIIPVAATLDLAAVQEKFRQYLPDAVCFSGMSHECLKSSRAALVKSGTSTLEAALLQVPMVLAYASSRSAEWVYRHIVRYRGFVGLVNLFLAKSPAAALGWDGSEEPVVPECILDRCTPETIANELLQVYVDGPVRDQMLARLAKTREVLMPPRDLGSSPLEAAARATWKVANRA